MAARRHLVLCTLLCLAAACAGGGEGTAPTGGSIAGRWSQGASLTDSANHQSHIHTGTFLIGQRGTSFSGTGQQTGFCHASSGDYTGPLADGVPFVLRDGVVSGSHVTFATDLCRYEGAISADGRHLTGTTICAYTAAGVRFQWVGPWLADRED
jgi:hypothetical protein